MVVPREFPISTAHPRELIDDLVESLALDELHGVIGRLAVLAHLEDRHDVGVVQPRRGPGLALEPLELLGVGPPGGGEATWPRP